MRISDWSSDVCSSDLGGRRDWSGHQPPDAATAPAALSFQFHADLVSGRFPESGQALTGPPPGWAAAAPATPPGSGARDRTSVVYGQQVSVRLALGGGGIMYKKNNVD